ncbi:MAG: hypothetical protein RLZ48_404 [Actinomycetota bacterium]
MRRMLVAVVAFAGLQSCSGGESRPLCAGRTSVPEYVLRFGQGLANFDDEIALSLEADSVSVLEVVLDARESDSTRSSAEALSAKIGAFVGVMNSHDWIITEALDDPKAIAASDGLGTEDTLREANTIEALVLGTCGTSPTAAAPLDSVETLPPPSYQNPTDTVPDAGVPDDVSDATALGRAVGIQFGLTLTQEQVECLGTELQKINDGTEAFSSPDQYQRQFQPAFDACRIAFEVPGS